MSGHAAAGFDRATAHLAAPFAALDLDAFDANADEPFDTVHVLAGGCLVDAWASYRGDGRNFG